MESKSISDVVEDLFGILKLYKDGSVFRATKIEHRNQIHDDGSAIWKDCLFDVNHNLYLRLYKPQNSSFLNEKLPVIFYLHAGGFCVGGRGMPSAHNNCLSLCSRLSTFVVSADYRLAPENRLPTAFEDGHTALKWLQSQVQSTEDQRDEWLRGKMIDFERVFVFGDSSGGTIAHHLAVKLGLGSPELSPIKIMGYILLSPFFGGVKRTKFEEERTFEEFWSQDIYDQLLRLALPLGSNTDHPMVNLFGPVSPSLESVSLDPILVLVGGEEILKDRAEEYARKLKELNKKIKYVEFEGKQHGFFSTSSFTEEGKVVLRVIHDFITEISM